VRVSVLGGARFARADDRDTAGAAAVLLLVGSVGLIVHCARGDSGPCRARIGQRGVRALAHFPAGRLPRERIRRGARLASLRSAIVVPLALYVATAGHRAACREWAQRTHLGAFALGALLLALIAAAWPLPCMPAIRTRACVVDDATTGAISAQTCAYFSHPELVRVPPGPCGVALWSQRRQFGEPRVFAPLAAFVLTLVAVCRFSPAQGHQCAGAAAAVALLGALGVARLRAGRPRRSTGSAS